MFLTVCLTVGHPCSAGYFTEPLLCKNNNDMKGRIVSKVHIHNTNLDG